MSHWEEDLDIEDLTEEERTLINRAKQAEEAVDLYMTQYEALWHADNAMAAKVSLETATQWATIAEHYHRRVKEDFEL